MTRGTGWFCRPNALARKRFAAAASRLAERRKSRVAPEESTAPYRLAPLALDPDVGLVRPPTVGGRFESPTQRSFHFRGVTLHPPPDGNVVDQKSALGKEFLPVTVGQ